MMNDASPLRAWAEIDLHALRLNVRRALELSQGRAEIMAIVKADAYGHGHKAVCNLLAQENISFFGVANAEEAARVEALNTGKRLFILGPTFPAERETIVAHDWTAFITSQDEAEDFNRLAAAQNKRYKVHLALNSGMGRGGFLPETLCEHYRPLFQLPFLEIEGLGSHMPVADEDPAFTRRQIDLFNQVCRTLGREVTLRYRHLANSAGLLAWDISEGTIARPGLLLYGHNPMTGTTEGLHPAFTLKSRVTTLQTLPPGEGVSYGRDFITARPSRVATVGIGYADGYPRQVSGKGAEVWLGGRRCPVLGRVTMDQIMVDVTDAAEVATGDEVELFGPHIPVEEIAEKAGTIVWDIFTGIGTRVKRLYCGEPPAGLK